MAVMAASGIERVSLTSASAMALAPFYEQALGFELLEVSRCEGREFEQRLGVNGGALAVLLGLGAQRLELLQFDQPGAAYPTDIGGADTRFQHCAVVVSDLRAAHEQLCAHGGWQPITRPAPQWLPAASGGVGAFKFRDPEGHPLELLAWPAGLPSPWAALAGNRLFLGIDHTAISVTDTAASIAFYEQLGLGAAASSRNTGPEQARLDGLDHPDVEVTALQPALRTPHLELLCYRRPAMQRGQSVHGNDVAAARIHLCAARAGAGAQRLVDPDGHVLIIH